LDIAGGSFPSAVINLVLRTSKGLPTTLPRAPARDAAENLEMNLPFQIVCISGVAMEKVGRRWKVMSM